MSAMNLEDAHGEVLFVTMFFEGLTIFSSKREIYAQRLAQYKNQKEFNENDYDKVFDILCEFLMDPECASDIADCFPQLLPAMVSGSISIDKVHSNDGDETHKLNCVVLGKLIRTNPDLLTFVLHYFDRNSAPFESSDADYAPSRKRRNKRKTISPVQISDYDLVTACYDILCSAPAHFKCKWNWSKFYKYLTDNDEGVRWVALSCIAIVLGMSESCHLSCVDKFLPNVQQFLTEYREATESTIVPTTIETIEQISSKVPSVVSIGGILLPVFERRKSNNVVNLVPVPSTRRNLRNLALAVSSNKCVCLQGAVGSGKTTLVEFLAQATGRSNESFVKVQLGDQTDSKMLLGMYRCTDIPGEFLWQPGILTEAVLTGKWLLLEDIDCAATDVASVIGHLVETGTLSVPGYRDSIHVKSGFQLFVTRRLIHGGTQKMLQASASLQKHWSCVNTEPLSKDELVTVVQNLFPLLNTVATRIVDVFLLFSVGNHEDDTLNGMRNGRQTSTRDLIKWCSRAVVDFDVSSPDSALKIFQDALDVFCYSVPNYVLRLNLAVAVAHKLGIIKTKADYFCQVHKPVLNLSQEVLTIGRAKLQRMKVERARLETRKSNFSHTRPSMCLLERIASCVAQKEPILLVGETGTGKTSCVQYIAQMTGHRLIVINMNQQSESADLLGGYKPVDLKLLISPIREEFEILFRSYFAIEPNKKFLVHIGRCFEERKWKTLATLMIHSTTAALKRLRATPGNRDETTVLKKWERMAQKLEKLQSQVRSQFSLAFSFVEGSLVKALRNGDWVLLDEINLATAETLECLSGLLEDSCGSLSLLERGDKEPIKRHANFAIFACMNPATDVGKKDLPTGLRNRFTEFFVDELTEKSDLQLLVSSYLQDLNLPPEKIESIVKFYLNVRKEAENSLLDGTGHKPHYSLRTLCRALSVSAQNPCGNVLRSLYEAFSLSFLTQLDSISYPIVQRMVAKAVLDDKTMKGTLGSPIPRPHIGNFVCFEGYWIPRGDLEPQIPDNYILTETVRRNLKDLVRVVSIGKMPVLLQGDTSVGKTSLITYLAKASGHTCVRINNHEHTDLQEYVGTYVADSTGKLVFKEGILVDAMRKGYWIILDELNLAPSDVLEALNRVLDDNRELFIPETQQVIKAHDNFMLFATQNPPGLYGGRKVLSRAFRNRFVELHFDEIPAKELQTILHKRCKMPETYCKQVINVMTELQVRRKSTATFAGKKGFITLRDLFRWAERYHLAPDTGTTLYDWTQHLADEGYLVLSSKVRHAEECAEIVQVLKKHLRRDVDPQALFSLSEKTSPVTRPILESLLSKKVPGFEHVVWTFQMRKMAVLVRKACDFKEPVLLIGETGGGKTTICQLLSVIRNQELSVVNCHMHTEASDFLGSLRPVREHKDSEKLFEWVDGPLVKAMKSGGFFLTDEISLADDSVLERLNSLLEPERKLLVAEKPSDEEDSTIVANENFIFVGTMNPGGDYGKKELSPALRNRFTEIWCEGCVSSDDLKCIMVHNLREEFKENVSTAILQFLEWLKATEIGKKLVISVRDVLTWVNFINCCEGLQIGDAFYHGASLSYIDGLGSGLTASENPKRLKDFKDSALKFIQLQAQNTLNSKLMLNCERSNLEDLRDKFGICPFYVEKGTENIPGDIQFAFASPTTRMNTLKLLRALQLKKPILLEGSPGVGKTSLVSALAKASGHRLLRLNLSDQTDISDLFGADLPVEGGKPGEFSWRDGPFLRALKNGDWILLDELNLASQSVLEGLNACLDHRGEVYVPELGKSFLVKPGTRLFGCQNPLRQGGGRRGLPKSFLNRFTQVFVDALEEQDLKFILKTQFPELPETLLDKMISFNEKLSAVVGIAWAHSGSPWEMNLRDVTRWCQVTIAAFKNGTRNCYNPGDGAELIYVDRMRTEEDKERVRRMYEEIFPLDECPLPESEFPIHLTKDRLILGDEILERSDSSSHEDDDLLLLREQKTVLRDLARCVNMNWMAILVGGSGCGKSSLVRLLANLAGRKLKSVVVNTAMDTMEILGGFEQTDYNRHLEELLEHTETLLIDILKKELKEESLEQVAHYHGLLERVRHLSEGQEDTKATMSSETKLFLRKIEELLNLVTSMKTLKVSCPAELQEIEKKLSDLSVAVENDKCLNAGGKFEWVDSILVKCLQNGTWLLLDQVNLCSPAILDRLNGLLEPNGALTIGEKGVDSDGNVFTVKPHKNFRLFLTMDPRYGEISRAMRNRGVEVSVVTPKDICEYDQIDLKSLLYNCGLRELRQQDLLLRIHESLSSDKFGLIELLQAASFTKQQMAKGFGFEDSLKNSCRQVYGSFDSRVRKEGLRKIDEILGENTYEGESFRFDLDAITPRICELRRNARLTNIRQQGFLLQSAARMLGNVEHSQRINFMALFDEPSPITDGREFLKHLLLDLYERSSMDDLEIRRSWCSKIFSRKELNIFEELSRILSREIVEFDVLARDSSTLELPLNFCKDSTVYNSMAIMLYYRLMIVEGQSQDSAKSKEIMSLREYSNAVCSGKLSCQLKNEPLITNFAKVLEQARRTIDAVLRDKNFSINDKQHVDLREDLKWYRRFYTLGEIELIDRSRGTFLDLRETSSSLKVHYKWLLKFFQRFLALVDPKLCAPTTQKELTNFSKICTNLSIDMSRLRKLGKKVKTFLHVPSPHFSQESMSFSDKLRALSKRLEMSDEDLIESQRTRAKIIFLAENLAVREELMDFLNGFLRNSDSSAKVNENLSLIENCAGKIVEIKEVDESVSKVGDNMADVEIWPIYEFFFLLFISRFQRKICEKFLNDVNKSICQKSKGDIITEICEKSDTVINEDSSRFVNEDCLEKFAKIPTIPPHLISLLKVLNSNGGLNNWRISLLLELFFSTEEFSERSFVSRQSTILLNWNKSREEEDCDGNRDFSENVINKSTLFNLIVEVLSPKTASKHEAINVRNYKKQRNQLCTLHQILWRNSLTLNSSSFDLSINDSYLLRFYINYYTAAISKVQDFPTKDLNPAERNELNNQFFRPAKLLEELKEKLELEDTIERGKAWMILGYLQIFIFSQLAPIDPVQKMALKSRYHRENVSEFENWIHIEKLQSLILGVALNKRFSLKLNRLRELIEESKNYDDFQAVRPSASFQSLREEIESFSKTIGSYDTIFRQIDRLNELGETIKAKKSTKLDEDKIREASIWKKSIERFSGKLERNFLVGFPDLVLPIITATSVLRHGVSIMLGGVRSLQTDHQTAELIYNLMRFPAIGKGQYNYGELVTSCSAEETGFLLSNSSDRNSGEKGSLDMTKIALKELENLSFFTGTFPTPLWQELNRIFKKVRTLWRDQELEKEERLREEQSLYRIKCDTKDELDYQVMFPGFQQDFLEMQDIFPDLQQSIPDVEKAEESHPTQETFLPSISMKDAREIHETHLNILKNFSNLSKRSGSYKVSSQSTPNFVDPLIRRVELLGPSMGTLPGNMSSKLLNSLNVLISERLNPGRNRGGPGVYDFYTDPNLPEIQECEPVFDALVNRIKNLLIEWPENPMLSSIELIIDRILGFSIDSPLSRFSVGVELLLSKLQQWEENARSDVSLAEFIQFFGERILRWRKIEISRWKDSLEVAEERLKTGASKWWFFLFDLVEEYLGNEEMEDGEEREALGDENVRLELETGEAERLGDDVKGDGERVGLKEKLIEGLERFFLESSLIEYETRLELIFLFSQHVRQFGETGKTRELFCILTNVYCYYKEFLKDVESKIDTLKAPIAKKLKDTIKITRWNDLSYWSVKNTAEKTRRTLHKHVKEFQKCLQEGVASYLTLKPRREMERNSRRDFAPTDFLIRLDEERSGKVERWTRKARQFCERIVSRSGYNEIRKDIESFVEDTLEESYKLRDLEIDKGLTKKGQVAQGKSILQRKKLALANYFKTLSQLGVSYRLGILTWKNRKREIIDFTSVPLDLVEIQRVESCGGLNRKIVGGLMEQWSDCDKYYYESLIKYNSLDAILNSTKSDLGLQNAERCRGFSVHLISMAHRQKKTIGLFFERFLPLSIQVCNLAVMMDDCVDVEDVLKASSDRKKTEDVLQSVKASGVSDLPTIVEILNYVKMESSNVVKIKEVLDRAKAEGVSDRLKVIEMLNCENRTGELRGIIEIMKTVGVSSVFKVLQMLEGLKRAGLSDVSEVIEILKFVKGKRLRISGLTKMPRQVELQKEMKNFRQLLITLEIVIREILIFLESCPACCKGERVIDLNEIEIPILHESGLCRDTSIAMKDSLSVIKSMGAEINSWFSVSEKVEGSGQIFLFHGRHLDFLKLGYEKIDEVRNKMDDFRRSFTPEHPIVESVVFLIEKINENAESFKSMLEKSMGVGAAAKSLETYRRKLDLLQKQVLLVIQEKLRGSAESGEEVVDPEKDDGADFVENTLSERLIGSLRKDISDLRLRTVSRVLGELLEILYELDVDSANDCIRLLLQQVPLLQQYLLLLHYYLHEQVASFRLTCKFLYLQLNIFLDLAANGFCQPRESNPTEEDDQGVDAEGGMGLAEGEGQKDVSDRIESEDQLEEAKRPGEEKENDDKDTKEEENGIDMSENFDSHLQDLERGEDDKPDDDDEDLDKEMGDTEESAEKLDEEIWKDEEEEDDGDDNEKEKDEKEESGKGEEIGNDELTAKEGEDDKTKNEREEHEGGEKEEEKKEINEFEEPEVNEDQIDPYHGKHQPEIEPESFDLPEDMNLDDEQKEDTQGEEENPFDIDQMKESKMPEEKEMEEETEEKREEEENTRQDSSDEDVEDEENGERKKEKVKDVDGDEEEKPEEDPEEQSKEDEQGNEEKVQPSLDEGSKEVDASQDVDSRKDGSRDAVESQSKEENEETDSTERNVNDKSDKGTGQSQTEERTGHSGSTKEENVPSSGKEKSKPMERRRKPGQSDENRSLLDDNDEPRAKKLKTAPTQQELNDPEEEAHQPQDGESEVYEHVKNTEEFDNFALDAATEEQIKKQASNLNEDNVDQTEDNPEDNDIEMHEDDPKAEKQEEDSKKQRSEKTLEKKEKSSNGKGEGSDEIEDVEMGGEIEGETIETSRILRGNESTIHTKLSEVEPIEFPAENVERKRFEIERMLSEWSREPSSVEAATAWNSISALTESSARELSEKLRLVLEPTLTSRLKGDYRTGRRINMRKIIPYIASEFRKDKIWLRRTKPSKRDYQVVLAIDDSSSMADNHSKELAFESLSLIGKAMTYLEVGQLAVVNFGERVNILHPLGENFTDESGARLIQEMKFEQKKTMIGELLDFTMGMFESHGSSSENAKLVAILSDGRGIFSEGTEKVNAAVRRAKLSNTFLVFIIVDNPLNKDSILDIRMPVFENGKLLGIRSYMDNFPFPFYIILRDLNTLPVVLSDALRQWFEIVGRIDT